MILSGWTGGFLFKVGSERLLILAPISDHNLP